MWPKDNFGDFDQAVNIAIAKLRSALGDSTDNPRYIETLPKRGYRFIAEVRIVDLELPVKVPEPAPRRLREIEVKRQSGTPHSRPSAKKTTTADLDCCCISSYPRGNCWVLGNTGCAEFQL